MIRSKTTSQQARHGSRSVRSAQSGGRLSSRFGRAHTGSDEGDVATTPLTSCLGIDFRKNGVTVCYATPHNLITGVVQTRPTLAPTGGTSRYRFQTMVGILKDGRAIVPGIDASPAPASLIRWIPVGWPQWGNSGRGSGIVVLTYYLSRVLGWARSAAEAAEPLCRSAGWTCLVAIEGRRGTSRAADTLVLRTAWKMAECGNQSPLIANEISGRINRAFRNSKRAEGSCRVVDMPPPATLAMRPGEERIECRFPGVDPASLESLSVASALAARRAPFPPVRKGARPPVARGSRPTPRGVANLDAIAEACRLCRDLYGSSL